MLPWDRCIHHYSSNVTHLKNPLRSTDIERDVVLFDIHWSPQDQDVSNPLRFSRMKQYVFSQILEATLKGLIESSALFPPFEFISADNGHIELHIVNAASIGDTVKSLPRFTHQSFEVNLFLSQWCKQKKTQKAIFQIFTHNYKYHINNHTPPLAILHCRLLANLEVEVGNRHSHQIILIYKTLLCNQLP